MRANSRLKQTATYEELVSTLAAARMLRGFLLGQPCPTKIGFEQGIELWDDYCEESADISRHYQIKSNMEHFSEEAVLRRMVSRRKNKPASLCDLSEFDKTIASLAGLFSPGIAHPTQKEFVICLTSHTVLIKKDLVVGDVKKLILEITRDGFDIHKLKIANDSTVERVLQWLKEWCGVKDLEHACAMLRHLRFHEYGMIDKLEDDLLDTISDVCIEAEDATDILLSYVRKTSSDTTSLTPNMVASRLASKIDPSLPRYAQFKRGSDGGDWKIAETITLKRPGTTNSTELVDGLWSDGPLIRQLRVSLGPNTTLRDDPLRTSLLRLSLHLPQLAQARFLGVEGWKSVALNALGGELGSTNDANIPFTTTWAEDENSDASVQRLVARSDQPLELDTINDAQTRYMLRILDAKIREKLDGVIHDDLRDALASTWLAWMQHLSEPSTFQECMLSMLRPSGESKAIRGALRLGPRNGRILADAWFLRLAVAVALSCTSFCPLTIAGRKTTVIALERWGGQDGVPAPEEVSDTDLNSLLGADKAKIVILASVKEAPATYHPAYASDGGATSESYAREIRPILLVTNSKLMRRSIRELALAQWRALISSELTARESDFESKVQGNEAIS